MVPGLLQTPEYAEAAFFAARPGLTPDQARALVVVQIQRKDLVRRNRRIHLHLIADGSALLRPVGGARVMAGQLRRLAEQAADPALTLQVAEIGCARQVISSAFAVLRLAEPQESDVACTAGVGGQVVFAKRRADVRAAFSAFGALASAALAPGDSLALIDTTAAYWQREDCDGH
jgi:Domain of unknown function (DUF5753)